MRQKLTKETINDHLTGTGIVIVGEYINSKTKTEFEGECGHKWQARPNSVFYSKNGCPVCNGTTKLSKEIVNFRLIDRGIQIVESYTYISSHTKTKFICSFGHEWVTTPASVMHGSQCPHCSEKGGYDSSKSGTFYALDFITFIKYGITNNLQRRLAQHKRNGRYTIAFTKSFEDGSIAQKLEREVDKKFGGRFATKEQCPDGYTETLCPSKLKDIITLVDGIFHVQ